MKEYTEQEMAILEAGSLAEQALKTPAFASAINELSEQLANAMISTTPEEKEKRELIYFTHLGLKEIVGILHQRVALKQSLEADREEQENA